MPIYSIPPNPFIPSSQTPPQPDSSVQHTSTNQNELTKNALTKQGTDGVRSCSGPAAETATSQQSPTKPDSLFIPKKDPDFKNLKFRDPNQKV